MRSNFAQNKKIATILTSSDYKAAGAVSTTIYKIFKKVEVAVSMVELISLLKTENSALQICQTNHHFVNATSERYLKLQAWVTECLDDHTTNKTLDMGIECILFQKKTTQTTKTIPYHLLMQQEQSKYHTQHRFESYWSISFVKTFWYWNHIDQYDSAFVVTIITMNVFNVYSTSYHQIHFKGLPGPVQQRTTPLDSPMEPRIFRKINFSYPLMPKTV